MAVGQPSPLPASCWADGGNSDWVHTVRDLTERTGARHWIVSNVMEHFPDQ